VTDIKYVEIVREGRELRNHLDFSPDGINVNFVQEHNRKLFVRTYERGVEDETLSCGTGVTASALAYAASRNLKDGIIEIMTRGGNLSLHFHRKNEAFTGIFLEGPAVRVFHGTVEI
jgi:diaminopimelate epimerase